MEDSAHLPKELVKLVCFLPLEDGLSCDIDPGDCLQQFRDFFELLHAVL